MAYNKILNNFKLNQNNILNDNTLHSTNNSFDFTDHFKPININNSIIFQNNDILVNENINLLQESNINEINTPSLYLNQYIGIKLLNTNDLSIFNNSLTNNRIILNSNINIENELFITGNIYSSISYTSSDRTNKIIRSLNGGIVVQVAKDSDNIYDYFKIGLSNIDSANNSLNSNVNITFLSNNKSFNIQNGIEYSNNLDINFLTSDVSIPQIDFSNTLLSSATTSLNSTLSTFYGTNALNSPNIFNVKKDLSITPNCTILRPCNNINNKDFYFTGDSHCILIENNKDQFDLLNGKNNVHLYIIDLTSQNFIDNLGKGFKLDFLLGKFKNNLFTVNYDNTTRKQNVYPNYLPFRENVNITKQLPLGFPYVISAIARYNATPVNTILNNPIYQWGPIAPLDNYTSLQNQFRTLINNSINIFTGLSTGPYNNKFYTPLNPVVGDQFSFWYYSGSVSKVLIYINGTSNLLTPMISSIISYPLNWVWDGQNWILNSTPNPYAYDAGGLNYPSHILLELPENHFISGQDSLNYQSHSIFRYKNNKNFYLYGNKNIDSELVSENLNEYSNGGWLYTTSTNINEKSNFKKLYKNIYHLISNNVLKTINSFNWQPYSNFQLIYLGNNEWYIN